MRLFGTSNKFAVVALAAMLWAQNTCAQELTPRAFWPAPTGTGVLILGYSHSAGDVLMDPSIPIFGVDSRIDSGLLGYLRTTDLFGRTTNLLIEVPYSSGTTTGLIDDQRASASFSGLGDVAASITVNLLGAPALTPEDLQALRANPRPILGFSAKIVAPTGHYDRNRLINVGANRWSAQFKLGSIIPIRPRWLLEMEAGVWIFGDDDDYLAGKREQESIFSVQAHLIRRFKPGFWASLDFNYFTGGEQTIGGVERVDVQKNSRIGGTLVFPFHKRHALKLGFSTGTRTKYGSDFNQVIVAYQRIIP